MSRFIINPAEARAEAEVHTAWCGCRDCKHVWDAAHCGLRSYSNIAGLILASAAFIAIALVIGVSA